MKRIITVLAVAALMAVMLVAMAGPSMALVIHKEKPCPPSQHFDMATNLCADNGNGGGPKEK